jgi:hypothetical protein
MQRGFFVDNLKIYLSTTLSTGFQTLTLKLHALSWKCVVSRIKHKAKLKHRFQKNKAKLKHRFQENITYSQVFVLTSVLKHRLTKPSTHQQIARNQIIFWAMQGSDALGWQSEPRKRCFSFALRQ